LQLFDLGHYYLVKFPTKTSTILTRAATNSIFIWSQPSPIYFSALFHRVPGTMKWRELFLNSTCVVVNLYQRPANCITLVIVSGIHGMRV